MKIQDIFSFIRYNYFEIELNYVGIRGIQYRKKSESWIYKTNVNMSERYKWRDRNNAQTNNKLKYEILNNLYLSGVNEN